jgi:hypothetical protein
MIGTKGDSVSVSATKFLLLLRNLLLLNWLVLL